jgi:hypothetical protein
MGTCETQYPHMARRRPGSVFHFFDGHVACAAYAFVFRVDFGLACHVKGLSVYVTTGQIRIFLRKSKGAHRRDTANKQVLHLPISTHALLTGLIKWYSHGCRTYYTEVFSNAPCLRPFGVVSILTKTPPIGGHMHIQPLRIQLPAWPAHACATMGAHPSPCLARTSRGHHVSTSIPLPTTYVQSSYFSS